MMCKLHGHTTMYLHIIDLFIIAVVMMRIDNDSCCDFSLVGLTATAVEFYTFKYS
jgi:hypothetical protein